MDFEDQPHLPPDQPEERQMEVDNESGENSMETHPEHPPDPPAFENNIPDGIQIDHPDLDAQALFPDLEDYIPENDLDNIPEPEFTNIRTPTMQFLDLHDEEEEAEKELLEINSTLRPRQTPLPESAYNIGTKMLPRSNVNEC